MKKFFVLILALTLLACPMQLVYALSEDNSSNALEAATFLGTADDDEGKLMDWWTGNEVHGSSPSRGVLFSMNATGVQNLLTTRFSGFKNFNRANLLFPTIYLEGRYYYSSNTSQTIRIGLCYYDSSNDMYVAENNVVRYVSHNDDFTETIARSDLSFLKLYFGFVKNNYYSTCGSISGNCTYSNDY